MGKLPAFQFYPGDWMKDPLLRACSVSARGLWIDMLCLMHESPRRGYLQLTGKSLAHSQLARMTGCESDEVSRLLQELEDSGVFSRTEHGVIFSRRMVADERKRALCSEAGKKGGGNPTFRGTSKGDSKRPLKPPPEDEGESERSSSSGLGSKVFSDAGERARESPRPLPADNDARIPNPVLKPILDRYPKGIDARAYEQASAAVWRIAYRDFAGLHPPALSWLQGRVFAFSETVKGGNKKYLPSLSRWLEIGQYDETEDLWRNTYGKADAISEQGGIDMAALDKAIGELK